jgi:membrane protein DedA with SNARE-associated domain
VTRVLASAGLLTAGLLTTTGLLTAGAAAPPPHLPGFLGVLSSPLQHYGLWAVILLVFVEDFGVPVPGETVLIAGAVYAGSGGLNIVAVGVLGFVAAVVGDNVGYAIGRFGGHALVLRWGRYVFLTEERLGKAEAFFGRHGGKIIAIARFIDGLRQANGLIAGITSMPWLKFLVFNMIGAALWVGCWVSVGYFAGQHITTIYDYITQYSLYAVGVVAVAIVVWIGLRLRRRHRARQAESKEAAQETASGDAAAQETAASEAGANETGAKAQETAADETEADENGNGQADGRS